MGFSLKSLSSSSRKDKENLTFLLHLGFEMVRIPLMLYFVATIIAIISH